MPFLQYMPDHEDYTARAKRRLESEQLDKSLPEGFPTKLAGGLVWDAESVAREFDFNYHLTAHDLEEIHNALHHFKGKTT